MFSIVDGVIEVKAGLASVAIVTDPPRETAEPLIVIELLAKASFAIPPPVVAIKVAPDATVIVSPESPTVIKY